MNRDGYLFDLSQSDGHKLTEIAANWLLLEKAVKKKTKQIISISDHTDKPKLDYNQEFNYSQDAIKNIIGILKEKLKESDEDA